MSEKFSQFDAELDVLDNPTGGSNFLVSAVMLLRRQKKDLQLELQKLRDRVASLESQNAAFLNVSADRLLQKHS